MSGIELIAAERKRQIEGEGCTSEHDDQHTDGSLKQAAIAYLGGTWPKSWSRQGDKRKEHGPIRRLVIAGALIAAEIDRLLRRHQG